MAKTIKTKPLTYNYCKINDKLISMLSFQLVFSTTLLPFITELLAIFSLNYLVCPIFLEIYWLKHKNDDLVKSPFVISLYNYIIIYIISRVIRFGNNHTSNGIKAVTTAPTTMPIIENFFISGSDLPFTSDIILIIKPIGG